MRFGIHPTLKRHDGGIYQYSVRALHALRGLAEAWQHEFVVFVHDLRDPVLTELDHPLWAVRPFRPPWSKSPSIDLEAPVDPESPMRQPDMGEWLKECGVDLMVYTSPHRLSFESGVPFIMAIHDIQHRLQPQFEEVSAEGEWLKREYIYRNAARTAAAMMTNSQTGRDQLLGCYGEYGLSRDRLEILRYPPPEFEAACVERCKAEVVKKYSLPKRFLLYPAQFWPHKNHVGLIEALGILRREKRLEIPLVLTGSASGEVRERHFTELRDRIETLGLCDCIHFLGYVGDEDLVGLYGVAEALVMPTFFGPTNLPVLEAWALECPVITSNVPGNDEQLGDAGILIDPHCVNSIADGIERVWTQPELRKELMIKGQVRCRSYTFKDFAETLMRILDCSASNLPRREGNLPRRDSALPAGRV